MSASTTHPHDLVTLQFYFRDVGTDSSPDELVGCTAGARASGDLPPPNFTVNSDRNEHVDECGLRVAGLLQLHERIDPAGDP
ncbi:hypothetical protein ACETU7_12070 [Rhodococcus sp. 3Y1]